MPCAKGRQLKQVQGHDTFLRLSCLTVTTGPQLVKDNASMASAIQLVGLE